MFGRPTKDNVFLLFSKIYKQSKFDLSFPVSTFNTCQHYDTL